MDKLKRAVIKEELVALTGDYVKALLLGQLMYWSERVKDFDEFIEEEKRRKEFNGETFDVEKLNGWIYKSAEELSEETMLGFTPKAIRTNLRYLIEHGWVDERNNPEYKWDRTKQYRVNLVKIAEDLQSLGYNLEGYKGLTNRTESKKDLYFEPLGSGSNYAAIPETTTENTTKITTEDIYIVDRASETEEENFLEEEKPISRGKEAVPYKEIVSLYHELCPSLPRVAQLTDTRKRKLKVLWNFVEGNLDKIKEVFEKAEESEFLSGRNAKWTGCNFDWLINTNNFVKVLEGSYNDRRSTGETHRRDEDDPFGIKAYLSQWGDDLSMYER